MADLELRQDGDVIWATMNRPERLNALSRNLVTELRDFFVGLYWRRDVRVVVLEGAGDAFCAGLDLKERSEPTEGSDGRRSIGAGLTRQREISEIVIAMRRCPQPIIACVDGAAAGGGFALALASDVRIVTPRARMNAAFIRIGLSACDIGVSYFLPRMVGSSVAAEYMLTGRFIDAERARELGLVSRIVPKDQLKAEAQAFVDDMLHATPLGLRLTKEALNHAIDAGGLEAAIAMEDRNQILASADGDFGEGVQAFLEKRKPNYTRREG
ncbi:enoyl-CoA hydratase-related protein [Phenylobacterium sp. J426]|uniref:enoyl-CoA hydratase/isomerase family protein n=1 Tax=Phenylobacterium sp. J426 TaxID=2898439 RepID=UPI00215152B1|nr:enoyl-CoA hydratase-related protein [Phenylobacterium sp. J426]MCR5875252.1 enoyl-CoA hydratase-related protein [Phenylobacterium sp. J426]